MEMAAKSTAIRGSICVIKEENWILEDCKLWDHIQSSAASKEACKVSEIGTIFLTGATSNLGPYILSILLSSPKISKVIILLRTKAFREHYLRRHLRKFDLEFLVDRHLEKIEIVSGDVAHPQLGLDPSVYKDLSHRTDAIFHVATKSNHLEKYEKEDSLSSIRAVNVTGAQNVLEFACSGKLKHVYYASTLIGIMNHDFEANKRFQDWQNESQVLNIPPFGYAQTKAVADVLFRDAVQKRGIPCKAFRFPLITGESETGKQIVERSHFFLKFLFYMKVGVMPDLDLPVSPIPVDICAKISTEIFFKETTPPGVYNLCNANSISEFEFPEIAKRFGRKVEIVPWAQFLEKLRHEEEPCLLKPFEEFYTNERLMLEIVKKYELVSDWRQNPQRKLFDPIEKLGMKLENLIGDPKAILENDIMYAFETKRVQF